jgi:hypothetical protein
MSEVSNADIYNVLINMRGDLGRLEGKVDGQASAFKQHVQDDKDTAAAHAASVATLASGIQKINISSARQRGFVTAIATVGGIIGTALGAAVDYFARGNH